MIDDLNREGETSTDGIRSSTWIQMGSFKTKHEKFTGMSAKTRMDESQVFISARKTNEAIDMQYAS